MLLNLLPLNNVSSVHHCVSPAASVLPLVCQVCVTATTHTIQCNMYMNICYIKCICSRHVTPTSVVHIFLCNRNCKRSHLLTQLVAVIMAMPHLVSMTITMSHLGLIPTTMPHAIHHAMPHAITHTIPHTIPILHMQVIQATVMNVLRQLL